MKKEILFKLAGLPTNFLKDNLNVLDVRKQKITTMVNTFPTKPTQLCLYGEKGKVVEMFYDKYPNKVVGIDFIQYFKDVFDNKSISPRYKQFTVVYNVGLERSVNTTFASKLLKGLIKEVKDMGYNPILCLEITPSDFERQYDIPCINKLVLPKAQENELDI